MLVQILLQYLVSHSVVHVVTVILLTSVDDIMSLRDFDDVITFLSTASTLMLYCCCCVEAELRSEVPGGAPVTASCDCLLLSFPFLSEEDTDDCVDVLDSLAFLLEGWVVEVEAGVWSASSSLSVLWFRARSMISDMLTFLVSNVGAIWRRNIKIYGR